MEARHDMRYYIIMVDKYKYHTSRYGCETLQCHINDDMDTHDRLILFCRYIYRGQPARDSKYI